MTLAKVNAINEKLFINNTLDKSKYPKFHNKRRLRIDDRDVLIYLNAHFDFKNQIWKSGIFEIQQKYWKILSDTSEYKYPILGNYFIFHINYKLYF